MEYYYLMSFADVNGIKISYEIQGEGYPLFLVHGYSGRKEGLFTQAGPLSQKFKVISFDLRCAGKSDHPNEPITMETFVDDIKGLMDVLEIERAHFAGHSLGGMIVQQLAFTYPKRVNKIILMHTSYSVENIADLVINTIIESFKKGEKDPEAAFWEIAPFNYHRSFRSQIEKNPKKIFYGLFSAEDLIKIGAENPMTIQDAKNQAHAFKDLNIYEKLSEIKCPTLLIAASHDRIIPKSLMLQMHEEIPNSTFKIIEKAGHGAPTSRAPEVNKAIIEFLEISKKSVKEQIMV